MSWAIWITGLPGSGKSVLAQGVATALAAAGEPAVVLELDVIRKVLTPVPTYTAEEREVVYRALAYIAAVVTECGIPVIIDATGHRRVWRDRARSLIPAFAEIQLTCPLEVCRERERNRPAGHAPAGIYAASGRPGSTVPGVDVPYEPALDPELTIDTTSTEPQAAVAQVVAQTRRLGRAVVPLPEGSPARWAIWITGLPGSGKTTLASRVAEALAARGLTIRVLQFTDLRRVILAGSRGADAEEIAHRSLVYTTKLLTDLGIPVIIDATAPRRSWRDMARTMIAHFAEVQLVCPPEICGDRERAARWDLTLTASPRPPRGARPEGPEVVLDYEPSFSPDLTLHTHLQDLWSATEEVLRLAERLHRTAMRSTLDTPRSVR